MSNLLVIYLAGIAASYLMAKILKKAQGEKWTKRMRLDVIGVSLIFSWMIFCIALIVYWEETVINNKYLDEEASW